MTTGAAHCFGDKLLPVAAGIASFLFSLAALIYLTESNAKVGAALGLGVFALLVCWIAAERPNGRSARAGAALVERLLDVRDGDLESPVPPLVHAEMPAVGQAVDHLFAQVRGSIAKANELALFDPVTALPNRVHFRQEADKLLAGQAPGALAAMMFVDLDRFKAINDNLGHARGDEALTMVADRLAAVAAEESVTGQSPIIARLAGDEFTMLFPSLQNAGEAERIARKALSALSEPFEIRGHEFDIGASIGVALFPRHGYDVATLMRSSDIAMYQAKSSGRGRVCLFDEALALQADERARTETDLRSALAEDAFELYFQPQVTPDTGELIAVEALLRWHHPEDGLRLPATFISIAEECGLIIDIGDWVIDAVGATLAQWREAGITTRLALNVSPRQLDRSKFFVKLRHAMTDAGADLSQLELEFPDFAAMASNADVLAEIATLRADGVLIALDDFGTGDCLLARLKEMPLDRIKIDRSLVRDTDTSESARVIMQALVQLAHGVGCVAVAKGVESDAQAEMLRLIGCDTLQGYALGEPMTGPDLMAWIAERGLFTGARGRQPGGSIRAISAA